MTLITNGEASIHDIGDSVIILTLRDQANQKVNERVISIAASLRCFDIEGLRDVVPTFNTVAVFFDPLRASIELIKKALVQSLGNVDSSDPPQLHEIDVVYGGIDGPDLARVAHLNGLSEHEVVVRHTARTYRVFMLGFMPGFPYLGFVDSSIAAPRKVSPNISVPAGSVGIAGNQTGIYPTDSPGGWQIIGRTDVQLFNPKTPPHTTCVPGDLVRFRRVSSLPPKRLGLSQHAVSVPIHKRTITILSPGLWTSVQDLGRWGYQQFGVSVAGPMDINSHRIANRLVGNNEHAASLEMTLVGSEIRLDTQATLAISGADFGAILDEQPLPLNTPVIGREGAVLKFNRRNSGARLYVAFGGGIDTDIVLGSRATHVPSGLGGINGRTVLPGDRLPLGQLESTTMKKGKYSFGHQEGGVKLRVIVPSQSRFFDQGVIDMLVKIRFTVSQQSDRMGYRLATATPIKQTENREIMSGVTFMGSIQLPPSGEPILLMADHQTTGGYPQIASVITADLSLAGQLAPGDWVEFTVCSRREAVEALVLQEEKILAVC